MGCASKPSWSDGSGGNGGSANNQSGSTSSAKDPFFDAAHNVNLEQYPGFDLRHPRDKVSHAIELHSPGVNILGKSEFDTFGEVHAARKNFIETYQNDMRKHNSNRFFEEFKYNSIDYVFGFEKNQAGWHEITGYPKR